MSDEIGNGHLKTIVKGSGIVLAGLFLSKLFSYLLRLFIANYFDVEVYGLFSLGLAVLGIFIVFATMGMDSGVIRYVAYFRTKKDDRRVKGVITAGLKMTLVLSFFMSFLLFFSSDYLAVSVFKNPSLAVILSILAISIPFSSVFIVIVSVFVGFKEIRYRVYLESIFSNMAKLVFIVLFGIIGFGIAGLAWAWVVASILALFLAFHFQEKLFPIFRTKVRSIGMKREILSYSAPLLFTDTLGYIMLWMDTLLIGYFMGAIDVGVYSAAMPTAQMLIMFPNALIALFLPIITELFAKDKTGEMRSVYKTVTRWTFYINFPLFLFLVFFSGQILNVLFGPEYVGGYMALILLSIGIMVRKSIQSATVLEMLKKTRLILYITIIYMVINVVLNLVLIPQYGIAGAATATMVAYIVAFSLFFYFSYRYTKIMPLSLNIMKSLAAGILAIVIVYYLAETIFTEYTIYTMAALFALFIIIYGFTLLLLKGLGREDIEIMKAIEKRSGIKTGFLRRFFRRFI